MANNESALSVALESRPSVSFLARLIDYGNGERGGQLLQAFIGAHLPDPHATYLKGPAASDINPSVFRFTGDIHITRPVANFAVTSDDGSRLSIGTVSIIDNGGTHGNNFGPGVVTVRFPAPGLYRIEILYNETQGQGAYVGFFSDMPDIGLESRLTRGGKATGLWVELLQPSASVGELIEGTVGLASSTERFARADSDVPIILQTDFKLTPGSFLRAIGV